MGVHEGKQRSELISEEIMAGGKKERMAENVSNLMKTVNPQIQ